MDQSVIEALPDDQPTWFISDLHLGDGTPSDAFFGKDQHLMALLAAVERAGARLVVVGDALDFAQAWTFTRLLRAHQELLSAMSRLAREGRLYYLIGNHDYDLSLYRDILSFPVCHELHLGDHILVQHGYQYDPFIGNNLEGGQLATQVHHLVERWLNAWLRVPLREFYNLPNRMLFWMVHKAALATHAYAMMLRGLGMEASADRADQQVNYWSRSNMGDPMCMFRPVWSRLQEDRWQYIVCGHSHLPGICRWWDRAYINTGSWTFGSSNYTIWDGEQWSSRDWITGRAFSDELYLPVLQGHLDEYDFWTWWSANYMGFLRFREGEEGLGRLRGWESYIRDFQAPSQRQDYARGPKLPLAPRRRSKRSEPNAEE